MRPPAVEQLLYRHSLAWEGSCSIAGVGALAGAAQRLYVTADGSLVFYHGPDDSGPAWTHYAPAPHPSGTVLARSEPATYEFIFHFDRNWDPLVATCAVPSPLDPALWAALHPHLLPLARERSPLWESRFYCRAALRGSPTDSDGGRESESGEAVLPRFIRVFAYEDHLSLSICSAQQGAKISLYGATTLTLPYADLAEVAAWKNRRRWLLRHPLAVSGQAVSQVEIDTPEIEATDWVTLDWLINEHRSVAGGEQAGGQLVAGVYAIGGIASERPLVEDRARILLGDEALVLQESATEVPISTIPYGSIHACAIQRHDPADDFLVVAPGVAIIVRQAGVGVRQMVEHSLGFPVLKQKLQSSTAVVVDTLTGIPGRPEALPTALILDGETLRAEWGLGSATLPVSQIRTRRLEEEAPRGDAKQLRLVLGRPGQEWEAVGASDRLLSLAQALDERALPQELARESLSELYQRWQRRRSEPLLWGALADIAWLDRRVQRLAAEAEAASAEGTFGVACDLLALSLDNIKAKLALIDLYLPYCAACEEESFLQLVGDVPARVRVRSSRYVERAVKSVLRSPLAHLRGCLVEIERNLEGRAQVRHSPRPGKLTLGFDASYCATVATAIGATVLGPLGAVAGVALSGLKLNQDTHSQNEIQANHIHDFEVNAVTWWRHLNDRIVPLLVREMVMECERLSMSLAPRDRQIHDRLAATGQEKAEERFRTALTEMLLAHARFRWGRIEAGPGECVTAGEILDGLVAVPPPSPAFSRLFPITARPLAGLSDSQPAPSPQP